MTASMKVAATAGLFVLAVATVVISAATHSGLPLFLAWLPLIGVGWVLTRAEPAAVTDGGPTPSPRSESDED
jgi:hypothetical protein